MSAKKFKSRPPQDERFKDTFFLVEATSFERLCLWNERGEQEVWEDQSIGYMVQVGTLDRRPVTIQIFWFRIDGRLVGFWDSPSQVVDHKMVEEWLDENCTPAKWDNRTRHARCDAMNFHLCIHAIRQANERDGACVTQGA